MANVTLASPNVLTDAGYLLLAPLGSALPANTVAGGVFTDAWPVAWINPGPTADGMEFGLNLTHADIDVAESYYPVKTVITNAVASMQTKLVNFTATNLAAIYNGATKVVTGTAGTTLTVVTPPLIGAEVRSMIGWESLDHTVRLVGFQALSVGDIKAKVSKAPNKAEIPVDFRLELPTGQTSPFQYFFAGTARG